MITDATLFIHGTGTTAFGALSVTAAGVYGDSITASQFSNLELDFGAPGSASSYPFVSQFPGYTEVGYPAAGYSQAEAVGAGGIDWGLHIQVMSSFTSCTNITFSVLSSSTTSAASTTSIASRTLTLAQLQVLGAHYYIAVNPSQVQEFNRFYANVTGTAVCSGTIIAWYGPRTGGEQ